MLCEDKKKPTQHKETIIAKGDDNGILPYMYIKIKGVIHNIRGDNVLVLLEYSTIT